VDLLVGITPPEVPVLPLVEDRPVLLLLVWPVVGDVPVKNMEVPPDVVDGSEALKDTFRTR